MEFRILGPLEVSEDGRPLDLGRGKERSLLVLLLLRANEAVSADVLIDELWQGEAPATAAKALQVYVSKLRKRLGPDVLYTRSSGYALEVSPEQLDLARFERLVEEASGAPPGDAAAKLRDALSLWRGAPLAEFAYEPFARTEISRLEELHLEALEGRIDADLATGRQAGLVAELEALVGHHPLRERLRGQLMVALYRAGRQADALAVYQDARRTLGEELGLEPSPELKQVEREILAHDSSLDAPAAPTSQEDVRVATTSSGVSRRRLLAIAGAVLAIAGISAIALGLTQGSPSRAVVALPNSLAVINPNTNRVRAVVRVADRPTQLAAYGDVVWVLHPDTRTLSLVSRTTHRVLRTVGLGGSPSGLVVDRRGIWVSDARAATVTLLDPEQLATVRKIETRRTPLLGRGPRAEAGNLASGFGSIWFASGDQTITRIDPRTGGIVARIRGVATGTSLGGIAFGSGSVWVAGPLQESPVTRIDPTTNAVVASIPIEKWRTNGIAIDGEGGVWVSDAGGDDVWRIDPATNAPVSTTHVGVAPLSVASGAGSIWVANSGDGTVSRIDPGSGKVVKTITVGGSPNGIAGTDDGIWVTVD